jgi:predicted ArsR family transcriptional regulator
VTPEGSDAIARLSVLDEPARRAAYLAVRTAERPLTRAEVADAIGISARLATFHLEKLVAEGLLEATYQRDAPSAPVGHPAKRYRPSSLELTVSIPPRRYDLAARILAEAFDNSPDDVPHERLVAAAAACGHRLGVEAVGDDGDGDGGLISALRLAGYEPAPTGDVVVLRNCPFKDAAEALPEVICAMNLAFVEGMLAGAHIASRQAVLSPSPGRCCVVIAA